MKSALIPIPPLSYPALLWHEGYAYLARTPLEVCVHPRSLFQETVQRARSGEIHLVDTAGRLFDIVDWTRIRRFGGINGIAFWLLGSIFAAPVLAHETRLALPEFKKTLARAIRGRYRYDREKAPAVESIREVQKAETYEAAMRAVPKV